MTCPSCSSAIPEQARFCPGCGAAAAGSSAIPTVMERPRGFAPESSGWSGGGRFVPGTVLAGRYRIAGQAGRGGMGEVYRADDLKLGQTVALKFLPASLSGDPERLARLHGEVRLARTVSHPNVCRVYDIAEADGQHFLTMEYVDGEDLASLLRRIGRLPGDKGVELARQLCAGLAAAHDRGVLHRDLKPANVMIDGRGRVRITDFGLAGVAGQVAGQDVRAGTPLYMAPEQLAGREVSVRSDLYALGLVLYELFTGRPAWGGLGPEALMKAHRESSPATPGSLVSGVDPVVERVVLRCLERDPAERPASALAVAAALPGGDPLAAALAAGETPSPEMVAAAGTEGAFSPRAAWACLAGSVIAIALVVAASARTKLINAAGLDLTPQALEQKAREIVTDLGHQAPAADTATGFVPRGAYLEHLESEPASRERLHTLASARPAAVEFWYRQSAGMMLSKETFALVTMEYPPMLEPGMAMVMLDPKGRLTSFWAIPPPREPPGSPAQKADWSPLFRYTALDPAAARPAEPSWVPPVHCDERAAWEADAPELPGTPLRIEACARRGKTVWMRLVWPWDDAAGTRSTPMETPPLPMIDRVRAAVMLLALAGALVMARRNLAVGRSDRTGAFRIALWFTFAHIVVWALWVDHLPDLSLEWRMFGFDTGWTLFNAAALWIFYLAIEPYVRRWWPETIISWSRVMSGRIRDPRVGRDLLTGILIGSAAQAIIHAKILLPDWLGWPPELPEWGDYADLTPVSALGSVLDHAVHAVLLAMQALALLLVLRLLLRRPWLATAVFTAIFAAQVGVVKAYPVLGVPTALAAVSLFAFGMIRFGLLSTCASLFVITLLGDFWITPRLGAWYGSGTVIALAALGALLTFAFHTSLGGRPAMKLLAD